MSAFYEDEPFPDCIQVRSSQGPVFNTDLVEFGVENVNEQRNQNWPYGRNEYNLVKFLTTEVEFLTVLKWFHNMQGQFRGFLLKDWAEFSSVEDVEQAGNETAFDQIISESDASPISWQVCKTYALAGIETTKPIKKIAAGTLKVGVHGVELTAGFTADTSGKITFESAFGTITNITQAVNAVITYTAGAQPTVGSAVFVQGVSGMTEMNDVRHVVTASTSTTVTLGTNSSAYTAYTSGGQFDVEPQERTTQSPITTKEVVTTGFQFYVPVRFDTDDLSGAQWNGPKSLNISSIPVIELFNP